LLVIAAFYSLAGKMLKIKPGIIIPLIFAPRHKFINAQMAKPACRQAGW